MKKEKVQPRLDFYQILFRRKWSVARWLENEAISTKEQFDTWTKTNEDKFTYSEKFLAEANSCFVEPVKIVEEILPTAATVEEPPAEDTLEQPILVVKGKNKKRVQTEDEAE
jgi:hypothetical protein